MYSSTHSATYISIYSYLLEGWPAVILSLSLSFSAVLSSHLWLFLSLSLSLTYLLFLSRSLALSRAVSLFLEG